jgi:uncharacterized protein YjbI with pentapeptide repeats
MVGHDPTVVPNYSTWMLELSHQACRAHEKWLDRGRQGGGRLVIERKNLSGARGGAIFTAARFVNCDLSDWICKYANFAEAEFVSCTLVGSIFDGAGFDRASFACCALASARFFTGGGASASFRDCEMPGVELTNTGWEEATFVRCNARKAMFRDVSLADAVLVDCDLRGADFRLEDPGRRAKDGLRARFERCDLRGAELDGWKLDGTIFQRCAFHGASGRPDVRGPISIKAANLSADGEGADVLDYVGNEWPLGA